MAIGTGQCHCGAIQYEVKGNLTGVINCHCSHCRRWHGNFSDDAVALLRDFNITQGADKLKWYESSSKARRGFRPDCGSSIFKDNKDGEKNCALGQALNPPTGLKHLKDISTGSKGDWYELQPR